jgi:hypothetical protein
MSYRPSLKCLECSVGGFGCEDLRTGCPGLRDDYLEVATSPDAGTG